MATATAVEARHDAPGGDDGPGDRPSPSGGRRPADLLARSVPSTRAVAGGLLVALAALVAFVAARGGSPEAGALVTVAAHDLAPGTRLAPSDLGTRRLVGADALGPTPEVADLVGAVTLGPLSGGDLVQASAVSASSTTPSYEVALALPADRAVQDRLGPGELVDVLATFGSGPSARTDVVARAAVVRSRSSSDAAFGGGAVTVTLGLDDAAVVLAVAHAQRAGEVTLVRSTGLAPGDAAPDSWPTSPAAGA